MADCLWEGVDDQIGVNLNFWNRYEDGSYGMVGNYRYAAETARPAFGSDPGDITFDAGQWPTVAAGEAAEIFLFVDMGVAGIYLDGPSIRGLEKVYRPGRYWFELSTSDPASNPNPWSYSGDGAGSWTQTQTQTAGQPAIYRLDVLESERSNAGMKLRLNAPGGSSITWTDGVIYHDDDAATKGQIVWADNYVAQVSKFNRIRDMEMRHSNEATAFVSNLAEEPDASWCTFSGYGPPVEFAIALANAAKCDLQFTIPAAASNNETYIRNRLQKVRDTLDDDLRCLPHLANEIWLGNGLPQGSGWDGLGPAQVFQQVHAPALGYPTTATGRFQAQAYLTAQLHKWAAEEFTGTHSNRWVPILETQIGNTGPLDLMLSQSFEGSTLGENGVEVQVAPYFPNGGDYFPWFLYDANDGAAITLTGAVSDYTLALDAAIASLTTTAQHVAANYPACTVATYEAFFQEGILFGSPPDWAPGLAITYVGFPVMYQPAGQTFPTIHTSKYASTYGTPLMTTTEFVEAEWENTGSKAFEDYTALEITNALMGIVTLKSFDGYRALVEDAFDRVRSVTKGCNTLYKLHSKPGLQAGFRCFGAERDEPDSGPASGIPLPYTGPYAPKAALQAKSLRPNGEVPDLGGGDPPDPPVEDVGAPKMAAFGFQDPDDSNSLKWAFGFTSSEWVPPVIDFALPQIQTGLLTDGGSYQFTVTNFAAGARKRLLISGDALITWPDGFIISGRYDGKLGKWNRVDIECIVEGGTPKFDVEIETLTAAQNGLIFRQELELSDTDTLFTSYSQAAYLPALSPGTAKRFSLLRDVERFRRADGNFHFRVVYPGTVGNDGQPQYVRWRQQSSPSDILSYETVQGYQLLGSNIDNPAPYGGLCRTSRNEAAYSYAPGQDGSTVPYIGLVLGPGTSPLITGSNTLIVTPNQDVTDIVEVYAE